MSLLRSLKRAASKKYLLGPALALATVAATASVSSAIVYMNQATYDAAASAVQKYAVVSSNVPAGLRVSVVASAAKTAGTAAALKVIVTDTGDHGTAITGGTSISLNELDGTNTHVAYQTIATGADVTSDAWTSSTANDTVTFQVSGPANPDMPALDAATKSYRLTISGNDTNGVPFTIELPSSSGAGFPVLTGPTLIAARTPSTAGVPSKVVNLEFGQNIFDGDLLIDSSETNAAGTLSNVSAFDSSGGSLTGEGLTESNFTIGTNAAVSSAQIIGAKKYVRLTMTSNVAVGDTIKIAANTVNDASGQNNAAAPTAVLAAQAAPALASTGISGTGNTVPVGFTNDMASGGVTADIYDVTTVPAVKLTTTNSTVSSVTGTSISGGKAVLTLNNPLMTNGQLWKSNTVPATYSNVYTEGATRVDVRITVTATTLQDIFGTEPAVPFNIDLKSGVAGVTFTDTAPPTRLKVLTADTDLDGAIDAVKYLFTEPIKAGTFDVKDFTLTTAAGSYNSTDGLTSAVLDSAAGKAAITVKFDTTKVDFDNTKTGVQTGATDVSGTLTAKTSQATQVITDASGNKYHSGTADTAINVTDGAMAVILTAVGSNPAGTVALTWSETPTISASTGSAEALFIFTDSTGKITWNGSVNSTGSTVTINGANRKLVAGDKIYINTYPANVLNAIHDVPGNNTVSTYPNNGVVLTIAANVATTPDADTATMVDTNNDGFFDRVNISFDNNLGGAGTAVPVKILGTKADMLKAFKVYDSTGGHEIHPTAMSLSTDGATLHLDLGTQSQVSKGVHVTFDETAVGTDAANELNAAIVSTGVTAAKVKAADAGVLTAASFKGAATPGLIVTSSQSGTYTSYDANFDGYDDSIKIVLPATSQALDTTVTTGKTDFTIVNSLGKSFNASGAATITSKALGTTPETYKNTIVVPFDPDTVVWSQTAGVDDAAGVNKPMTDGKVQHSGINAFGSTFYTGTTLKWADGTSIGDMSNSIITDGAAPAIISAGLNGSTLTLTLSEPAAGATVNAPAKNYITITDADGNLVSLENSTAVIIVPAASSTATVTGLPATVKSGQSVQFYNSRTVTPVKDAIPNTTKTTAKVAIQSQAAILNAYGLKDEFGFYDRVIVSAKDALKIVKAVGTGKDITNAFQVRFNNNILEHPTAVKVNTDGSLVLTLKTRLSIANDNLNAQVIYTAPTDTTDSDTANDSGYITDANGLVLAGRTQNIVNGPNSVSGQYSPFILNLKGTLSNFPVGTKVNAYLTRVANIRAAGSWNVTYNGITMTGSTGITPKCGELGLTNPTTINLGVPNADCQPYVLHTDADGDGLVGDYAVNTASEYTSDNGQNTNTKNDLNQNNVSDEMHDTVIPLTINWKTGKITGKGVSGVVNIAPATTLTVAAMDGSVVVENSASSSYSMPVYGTLAAANDGGWGVTMVAQYPNGTFDLLNSFNSFDPSYIPFMPQYGMDSDTKTVDLNKNEVQSVKVTDNKWNIVPIPAGSIYKSIANAKLPALASSLDPKNAVKTPSLAQEFASVSASGVPTLVGYRNILSIDNNGVQYRIQSNGKQIGSLGYMVGGYAYMVDLANTSAMPTNLYFFGTPVSGSLDLVRNKANFGWNLVEGTSSLSGFDYAIGFDSANGADLQPSPTSLNAKKGYMLHLDSASNKSTINF